MAGAIDQHLVDTTIKTQNESFVLDESSILVNSKQFVFIGPAPHPLLIFPQTSTKPISEPLPTPAGTSALLPFAKPIGPLKSYSPEAALAIQTAITLAEDNPQNHYDVLVTLSSEAVTDAKVYETRLRADPGVKRGDEVCFWASVAVDAIASKVAQKYIGNAIYELCLVEVLAPAVIASGIATAVLAPPLAPVAPWVTAIATRALCWGSSKVVESSVGAVVGGTFKYTCNMIRVKTPKHPNDPGTFNLDKPEPIPLAKSYEDLTDDERIWRQYRDQVDYLKRLHETRLSAYPSLTQSQINARRKFQLQTTLESENTFALRREHKEVLKHWLESNGETVAEINRQNKEITDKNQSRITESGKRNEGIAQAHHNAHAPSQAVSQHIDSYSQLSRSTRIEEMRATIDTFDPVETDAHDRNSKKSASNTTITRSKAVDRLKGSGNGKGRIYIDFSDEPITIHAKSPNSNGQQVPITIKQP